MQNHPFYRTYVVCTRRVRRGGFESEPGTAVELVTGCAMPLAARLRTVPERTFVRCRLTTSKPKRRGQWSETV